jgi:hypothetical protein
MTIHPRKVTTCTNLEEEYSIAGSQRILLSSLGNLLPGVESGSLSLSNITRNIDITQKYNA